MEASVYGGDASEEGVNLFSLMDLTRDRLI